VEDTLPVPLGAVMGAIYDMVLELSRTTDDPPSFQHRFFAELTRVELAMLKQRADVPFPMFPHPLPALKQYRAFMCGASIYEDMGNAKLRLRDHDTIEIRYWKCPYASICTAHEERICVRTHSLTEASDLMSPARFREIESLHFSEDGNCQVFVQVNFTGDLRDIDPEVKVIDEKPCLHLTREEADTFLIRTLLVGAEYAANHLPEVNVRQTLRDLAGRIQAAGIEERYLVEFPFLKRSLRFWSKGKNAFTRSD
jgi:hypothetical protein